MTIATLSKDKRVYELKLDGHANNADVCVAISTIAYTISALLKETDKKGLTETEKVILEPGDATIRFTARLPLAGKMIAETMASGLRLLSDNYPDAIRLNLTL